MYLTILVILTYVSTDMYTRYFNSSFSRIVLFFYCSHSNVKINMLNMLWSNILYCSPYRIDCAWAFILIYCVANT